MNIDSLVADDLQLDHDCVDALGALILALGPTEPAREEWKEGEAVATQAMREVRYLISSRLFMLDLNYGANLRASSQASPRLPSHRTTFGGAS